MLSRIEACLPSLRRYAIALLRNRDDADDLVHDCVVRALDKLHTRRDEADLRAWLFTIMHNVFVSQLRRKRARPSPEPLEERHEEAHVGGPAQDARLQWRDLMRALAQLSDEQRSVLLLVSVEDLSYAQAAAVLDVPIGTVMSRLSRARERLRQLTEGERPVLRRVT
ncbi:MAG: sigma-70 family RNA polymerase sigma factor [Rhodospirillales bacterium]|nr:sigma-70 family RNA polymerase sigma factor [Rhodospirillales bacterium]MBN8897887.1 sigma-70 family RNA polymerase sigma factor [Rhodospirillales bacterium]